MVDFTPSPHGTIGVEFEATVIDRSSGMPLLIAERIADEAQGVEPRGVVSVDMFLSTLELTTGVCRSMAEVRADLLGQWQFLRPLLDASDASLLGMGLHPVATGLPVINSPRIDQVRRVTSWPSERIHTTGTHVHVGMPDGDTAVRTATRVQAQLPVVLALSAASPYYDGRRTGLASTRMSLFDAIPRTGLTPDFAGWADYADYFSALAQSDPESSFRDAWWDVRLQPTYGTIEIRVMDSVADLDDTVALCALTWCLALTDADLPGAGLSRVLLAENRWRAIRDGLDAQFIVGGDGETMPLRTTAHRLIDALGPTAERLGCSADLERCHVLADGRAAHQSIVPADGGDAGESIEVALQELRVDW